ncbi:hypothetical protein protein, putative [Babesia ovis]|uniref:DUF1411 domain-containing protein n=1 Tax=Babesia ovis TaxID=5869 RepID=A0A9W5WV54_BABOV|nr:hypothetical protein protein, putative [Babesia ovis]
MAGSMVSSSSKSDLVVASRRGNGLFKVAKWAMGIAAVGGAISGSVFATDVRGEGNLQGSVLLDNPRVLLPKDLKVQIESSRSSPSMSSHIKLYMPLVKERLETLVSQILNYTSEEPGSDIANAVVDAINKGAIVLPRYIAVYLQTFEPGAISRMDWDNFKAEFAIIFAKYVVDAKLGPKPSDAGEEHPWMEYYYKTADHIYNSLEEIPGVSNEETEHFISTPDETHLLRDNAKRSASKKKLLNDISVSLIPTSRISGWSHKGVVDPYMKRAGENLHKILTRITDYSSEDPYFDVVENIVDVLNKKGRIVLPRALVTELYNMEDDGSSGYSWENFGAEFAPLLAEMVVEGLFGPRPMGVDSNQNVRELVNHKVVDHIKAALTNVPRSDITEADGIVDVMSVEDQQDVEYAPTEGDVEPEVVDETEETEATEETEGDVEPEILDEAEESESTEEPEVVDEQKKQEESIDLLSTMNTNASGNEAVVGESASSLRNVTTENAEKTKLKELSMTVGKAEKWILNVPKLDKIDLGPVKKFIFDTIAGMTKNNPGNADFGLSEYTVKTLNKNDTIEVPADIVRQINYLLHNKRNRYIVEAHSRSIAHWFAHKLMVEGSGPAPKDKSARKLWDDNFNALKQCVLMSIYNEYKSGWKVQVSDLIIPTFFL